MAHCHIHIHQRQGSCLSNALSYLFPLDIGVIIWQFANGLRCKTFQFPNVRHLCVSYVNYDFDVLVCNFNLWGEKN
jgi:hypothetical protein